MNIPRFIKTSPDNFTPPERTPWGGETISKIKKANLKMDAPLNIGESWEISSDLQFTSKVFIEATSSWISIEEFLKKVGKNFLGSSIFEMFGAHLPILLKWIDARDPLSVQIHPHKNNEALRATETGKPEAWLVVQAASNSTLYLGLQDEEIKNKLGDPHFDINAIEPFLHKVYPKIYDYISVPFGCIHALGPGIFVIEPQLVWPKLIGKTWRVYDWKRGNRELHTKEAISAINWQLPFGTEIETLLCQNLSSGKPFLGTGHQNPFAAQLINSVGEFEVSQLREGVFTLITCWSGRATLVDPLSKQKLLLAGGESAIISAEVKNFIVNAEAREECLPGLALFSLNIEAIPWHF